jgi:cytochrome c5
MNVQNYLKTISISAAILCSLVLLQGCSGEQDGAGTEKDTDARTAPYGTVKVAGEPETAPAETAPAETAPAETAPAEAAPVAAAIDGKALYAPCAVCHAAGVANAPKLGDTAAWAPRIATGMDAMVTNAIKGKGAMPPKGTRADYSDAQIRAVVEYMVNASK